MMLAAGDGHDALPTQGLNPTRLHFVGTHPMAQLTNRTVPEGVECTISGGDKAMEGARSDADDTYVSHRLDAPGRVHVRLVTMAELA